MSSCQEHQVLPVLPGNEDQYFLRWHPPFDGDTFLKVNRSRALTAYRMRAVRNGSLGTVTV